MSNTPGDPYGPCPCGSGKKRKFCCGGGVQTVSATRVFTSGLDTKGLDTSSPYGTTKKANHRITNSEYDIKMDAKAFVGLSSAEREKICQLLMVSVPNDLEVFTHELLEALEIAPRSRALHSRLALAYYKVADLDSALATCDKLIAGCHKVLPMDFARRATYRYIRGDDAGADADIAEAMRRKPETPFDTIAVCTYLALERKHAKICTVCERSPFRQVVDILYFYSVAYANFGKIEAARHGLRMVAEKQSPHQAKAAEYAQMLGAGKTPQTIFGDWRYLNIDEVLTGDVLFSEQIKAGFKFGKRIPAFHDRRWVITACEYLIESRPNAYCHDFVEIIARSNQPRAADTLLALAAHRRLARRWMHKLSIIDLIRKSGFAKPDKAFNVWVDLPFFKKEIDLRTMKFYVKILLSPFWLFYKFKSMLRRMIFNKCLDLTLYTKYGHYARPPAEEEEEAKEKL